MSASSVLPSDALLSVVLARNKRLPFRLGLVAVIAAVSLISAGWRPVAAWAAVYTIHQLIEAWCCPRTPGIEALSRWQSILALGLLLTGNVIFSALGVLQVIVVGPWGLAFACMIWSGAVVQVAAGNPASRWIIIACAAPPAACFIAIPFLVAYIGGPPVFGILVVFAAAIHAVANSEAWSGTRKHFETERRERLAIHVARHDPATGLPNRLAFEEAIAAEDENKVELVVAVLGIDRFDDLQGAIGYALVDRLIGRVTARIDSAHGGLVARLSASTLGVMFHAEDLPRARAYASGLQAAMAAPVVLDGIDIDVSFTIGLALYTGSGGTTALLEHAGMALGAARKAMIAIKAFEPSHDANPAGNLSLMSDMLRSIDRGEITNHYQPKYDLRSGRLVAVEALVRWQHPERGNLAPDDFIPLAEETGRIRELTLDVLSRAVRDQAWLAARGHPLNFAVNLSGRLLNDPDAIRTIIDIARPAAARISMEVTETAMMAHPEQALALLGQLKRAGIGISIDDYGSGLSSLAYLKNIPAEELKIDKSFVTHMDSSRRDCLLVRSTIALAHGFGLRVVAEGVESGRTLEILGQMNCDLAQGYHMARPMPIAALAELAASGTNLWPDGCTSWQRDPTPEPAEPDEFPFRSAMAPSRTVDVPPA